MQKSLIDGQWGFRGVKCFFFNFICIICIADHKSQSGMSIAYKQLYSLQRQLVHILRVYVEKKKKTVVWKLLWEKASPENKK